MSEDIARFLEVALGLAAAGAAVFLSAAGFLGAAAFLAAGFFFCKIMSQPD
jgi:hypothetical protein